MSRRRGPRAAVAALALIVVLLAPAIAPAVQPDEMLDDPVLEDRARALSQLIRCLVCQNESIDTSNAELARELRLLVRERLTAGDSDQEVLDFLVARYLLWFGPPALLLVGLAGLALHFKRRRPRVEDRLNAEEQARLARLLKQDLDAE
jgi:cytochrome c-type biogenesis protein CcmH